VLGCWLRNLGLCRWGVYHTCIALFFGSFSALLKTVVEHFGLTIVFGLTTVKTSGPSTGICACDSSESESIVILSIHV
jgi:hypothetical protein